MTKELTFVVEQSELLSKICGSNDDNLKLLEDALGITVYVRGNEVSVIVQDESEEAAREKSDKVLLVFKKMLDEATKVNTVEFDLTDTEPDIFSSKVGGTPYIPHGVNAPADKDGREMKLLAQIDCTLLSELPDFPHEGMLQF